MSWRDNAACRPYGKDWFELGKAAQRPVCASCPVAEQCLAEILQVKYWERYETWAGIVFHGRPVSVYRVECGYCGNRFFTTMRTQVTCSAACIVRLNGMGPKERQRRRLSVVPELVHEDTLQHAVRETHPCDVCGELFDPRKDGGRVQVTCDSEACKREHWLRQRREKYRLVHA